MSGKDYLALERNIEKKREEILRKAEHLINKFVCKQR